jgi:pre-mRNA-splicing factor ATP-dependent RNA helicase DHX15/PRP43
VTGNRLLEFAPAYFNLAEFKDGETKRALMRTQNKRVGKRIDGPSEERDGRKSKKQRK